MTLAVRLDKETEKKLFNLSRRSALSKSAIVKESLKHYLKQFSDDKTPYELGQDLFGRFGNISTNQHLQPKQILKNKIREKNFN